MARKNKRYAKKQESERIERQFNGQGIGVIAIIIVAAVWFFVTSPTVRTKTLVARTSAAVPTVKNLLAMVISASDDD